MPHGNKETRLVLALASGASAAGAAKRTGCSKRTVFRRLKDDAFRREVAQARGRIMTRATAMLARTSIRAVATLRKLLDHEDVSVKRMAARGVLDALTRMSPQTELEERMAGLESSWETLMKGDAGHEHQKPSEET